MTRKLQNKNDYFNTILRKDLDISISEIVEKLKIISKSISSV